ncbi:FKBP-type peptidyl-prolyl cis-trans isomerase [Sporichthya polymorpha]|uniref:FKBP-type peptidyl-prolyl cis-trans isomerase n=1 Tax=Sporichthya polymorpha TaxID=35751 RepID=UPI0012EB265B|nr:FKBP-type peptidyl-prolyl cis-trans isomerase [Sporichthya polymorpha]
MRRLLMLLPLLTALILPAACGGDDDKTFAFPTVSSAEVGVVPEITSNSAPPKESELQVLTEGKGRALAAGDMLVADLKSQVWSTDGKEIPPYVDTFSAKRVLIASIDEIVPGVAKKLPGVKVGSRVVLVTPPADGFGEQGNPQIGVQPEDSLVFVFDILDAFGKDALIDGTAPKTAPGANLPKVTAGKNPKITIPKNDPPSGLVAEPLLVGKGPKVEKGQEIVAQYTGVIWRNGVVFDSSWKPDRGPFAARVAGTDPQTGEPGVIEGWVQGLAGQRVGSRVLLVIPPKLGYGKEGNPGADIQGTDTLVFVVDILGAYNTPAKA